MVLTSSATNSSYSSSVSSSEPHPSPYHHQPTSSLSLSLGSNIRRKEMPKSPRFYSTPMDDGSESTPVQAYGLEERTPSIIEKPKLLRRMSHALDDIKEDFSLQIDPRSTADKLKRRSTLIFDGSAFNPNAGSRPETPVTAGGPPRSRPMSIMSFDAWSSPPRRLSRRLSHRLSIWSQRGKAPGSQAASISSPNLIGSSTQYATRSQASFI